MMHRKQGSVHRPSIGLISLLIVGTLIITSPSRLSATDNPRATETVRGTHCYRYGDNESFTKARETAINIALKEAIRSHRVFVESSTRVKNFQLEDDIIATTSSMMLKETTVEKEVRKPQEVCVTITASFNPSSTEELIRQRLAAKEVAIEATTAVVPAQQGFGLKVWTNKSTNSFSENERLIIYVKSDRDAYLKLDYFQANGTVAHLVPNMYRGQGHITGGQTYAFGDDTSPEHFIVQEPYGDEVIKAIVSVTPFDLANESVEAVGDSRTYIKTNLRGIKLVAAESSVSLKTVGTAVSDQKNASKKPVSPEPAKP
jgi:Domain of unknown function (DUF4384)